MLGFDVDDKGKTTLPHEVVTLLRVQNLPDPRDALHALERAAQPTPAPGLPAPSKDPPIFLGSVGRLMRIDVGALFRMAILGRTVEVPIATEGTPKDAATAAALDRDPPERNFGQPRRVF